jgi:hypothetical protein
MWLHISGHRFDPGEFVLPRSRTGVASSSWDNATVHAQRLGQYRPDRVHVLWCEPRIPPQHHRGHKFGGPHSFIYEVRPVGTMRRDTDPKALPHWHTCRVARVIRCVYPPA